MESGGSSRMLSALLEILLALTWKDRLPLQLHVQLTFIYKARLQRLEQCNNG